MNAESLLEEYKQTLSDTRILVKRLKIRKQIALDQEEPDELEVISVQQDIDVANSWISNLKYCIKWLKTGRQPGSTRGAERRSAYEREKPFDPMVMQRFFRSEGTVYLWDQEDKAFEVSESERQIIRTALAVLSEREQEVYLMSRGHSLTQNSIAEKMCLSRSTVKTMLSRADKKIARIRTELLEKGCSM